MILKGLRHVRLGLYPHGFESSRKKNDQNSERSVGLENEFVAFNELSHLCVPPYLQTVEMFLLNDIDTAYYKEKNKIDETYQNVYVASKNYSSK